MVGIYKIENVVNGKVYIGQSVNVASRWKDHLCRYNQSTCRQYYDDLYVEMREHGIENFKFQIIEVCNSAELNSREQFWIDNFGASVPGKGYNRSAGGDGVAGCGVFLTKEEVADIQYKLINETTTQCDIAAEYDVQQAMISYINTGALWKNDDLQYPLRKKAGSSHKHDSSVKNIEFNHTEDEIVAQLRKCGGNFFKVGELYGVDAGFLRKWCRSHGVSYRAKDYISFSETNKRIKLKVSQYDPATNEFIAAYDSVAAARNKTGVMHIKDVCDGKRNTAGGYIWRYSE